MTRVDSLLRGKIQKVGFVRKDEVEDGGEESGVGRRTANILGAEAALGEKAPEAGAIARDEAEGMRRDGFGGFALGVALVFWHGHFLFRNECGVPYHGTAYFCLLVFLGDG